ncbi:hypothetical protein M885DRAFT_570950 [Pelagophyceae sp. CCMP2097]|nr:hypothetical protein M885DRAFT_570950 [Pelagophyceae sp. CCMP2097]
MRLCVLQLSGAELGYQAKTPPPTGTPTLSEHTAAAAAGKESEIPVVFVQMNNLGDPNRANVYRFYHS